MVSRFRSLRYNQGSGTAPPRRRLLDVCLRWRFSFCGFQKLFTTCKGVVLPWMIGAGLRNPFLTHRIRHDLDVECADADRLPGRSAGFAREVATALGTIVEHDRFAVDLDLA